jgi:hypothetical protein
VAVLAIAGCGSGGTETSASLTKAQYIKQADKLCRKENKERIAILNAFAKEHHVGPGEQLSKSLFAELTTTQLLPLIQRQADRLRKRETPSDAKEEVASILAALEAAVHQAEAKPLSVLGNPESSPFARPRKMAKSFGFTICALY